MNYNVASKVIEKLYKRVDLDGFNQNQIIYILQGYIYEITNRICRWREGIRRDF